LRLKISLAQSDEHDEKLIGFFEACGSFLSKNDENTYPKGGNSSKCTELSLKQKSEWPEPFY